VGEIWVRSTKTAVPNCAVACSDSSSSPSSLLPALTALENTMLPLELAGRSDARATAQGMLDRVGLGARLGHYPKHLSGGEQQRVALARAFAMRPQLLLADEPTGNLDVATGAQVIELMFDMNAEAGTTLILVTHDEALAHRCGRTLRLSGGRPGSLREGIVPPHHAASIRRAAATPLRTAPSIVAG
jgi:predicted ABC-type transport system involved in lysophospholipase L1 biosynthesis ATPase subunit